MSKKRIKCDIMSKARETLYRESLEKQLEVNDTWHRVFSIEASTAKLKLSDSKRRNEEQEEEEESKVFRSSLAEVDVVRCSLRVNRLEEKLCEMRSREVKTLLKRARNAEVSALTRKLSDLKSTINAVKRYPNVVSDPKRKEFFVSDCHQQWGLGKWYCECLSERSSWTAYPSEKWFVTKSGVQLYSPMGRMTMDFSDQSVYSHVESCLYGTECLSSKSDLAFTAPEFLPQTWHIRDGVWSGSVPPPPSSSSSQQQQIWFLKECNRNFATGITILKSSEECLSYARPGKSYVVQSHYPKPLLVNPSTGVPQNINGHKFHVRLYMFLRKPQYKKQVLELYTCRGHGWICIAKEPWNESSTSRHVQITRDRSLHSSKWDMWPGVYRRMRSMVQLLVNKIVKRVEVPDSKPAFELFGVDFIMTQDERMLMYEVNAGPCVQDSEREMITKMLNICIPWGVEDDGVCDENVMWEQIEIEGVPSLRVKSVTR